MDDQLTSFEQEDRMQVDGRDRYEEAPLMAYILRSISASSETVGMGLGLGLGLNQIIH